MGTIISVLNKSGAVFCQHGLTMLVQFGLLVSLLFLADIAIRKRAKASLRYCLWCLLLVKLVLPTTLSLPTGIGYLTGVNFSVNLTQANQTKPQIQTAYVPTTATPAQTSSEFAKPINSPQGIAESRVVKTAESPTSVETIPLNWRGGIFIAWLLGVLALLAEFIRRVASIKKVINQSKPAPERLVDMVHTCQEKIGVKGLVDLRLSNNMVSPAVCGLLRHVIIAPTGLLEEMDGSKLEMVLMHELSHIKRADLWINFIQTVLQIFYFYNPFVWAANAYVCRVREQAVDEMVLTRLKGEAASYSNTLIDVAEKAFSRPQFRLATVSIIESKSKLKERIKIMLSKPIPKDTKIGFVGLTLIIAFAAVLLPMAKGVKTDVQVAVEGPQAKAGNSQPVISAVEFGDTNGTNTGKDNRMSNPEKTGVESTGGGIDLLKQYPTTLTGASTNPQDAREWQFTSQDIYSISRFSFDVNNSLQVKIDSAYIGIGHCKDGAVWAVVIPREHGTIKSLAFGEELIDHLWLRFHPREVLSLFPKDTVIAGGDKNLWGRMNEIAKVKMNSSWQAGGRAMIPAPKDFTVDADTKKNVRRFFVIDSETKTAEYIAFFEGRIVPARTSSKATQTPYTQAVYDEIGPDGTITFKNTIREINRSGRTITFNNFINSDFVQVTAMKDADGNDLKLTSIHDGDIYRYEVTFNKPIPPGALIEYTSEGTMKGLIKPVAGKQGVFQYYMRHSPAAGEPTQRVETYLLPAGAELISTTPEEMERRTKDGRIELHVEKIIPPDGSITTSFQYHVP